VVELGGFVVVNVGLAVGVVTNVVGGIDKVLVAAGVVTVAGVAVTVLVPEVGGVERSELIFTGLFQ
jgi:hypothetical protein